MPRGSPKTLAAAAKCTGATGAIALASWGAYGLEHARNFESHVQVYGAWVCGVAMTAGILLAAALTFKASIVTLFGKGAAPDR